MCWHFFKLFGILILLAATELILTGKYNSFDFISSPIVVFNSLGEIVFTNATYNKKIKSIEKKDYNQGSKCTDGIVFSTEKGVVKCYLVSSDIDDIGNKICIYKEITPFVSRKSMTEIIATDTEKGDYALRKIIEKNLRMSSVIDSLESGIIIEGSSGNLIQVNNSLLKIITSKGFSELPSGEYDASFFHKILADLIDSDDYLKQKDWIINEHKSGVYTDEVRFKDGRIYTRFFRQLYVGDEPKGYLWKFKDITIRKELENFNVELEANIQALESCESVGIYMEYCGYKFVNKGLETLLEADRDTLICNGLEHYISGKIYTGEADDAIESIIPYTRKDGTETYLNFVSDSLTVYGSQAHVITIKDNTENVLLHRNLEDNEIKFRNIFEKNLAVMLIFDPATMRIVNANKSAIEFYGKSLEELTGLEMCDITIVGDMNACMLKLGEMVKTQSGSRISANQRTANGSIREVELLMSPLGEKEGDLLFVIVDDVHERAKYQRELESLNANLLELVEKEADKRRRQDELLMEKSRLAEMGEMIGNIAHQWRQPLNALGFIIQDLQDAHLHNELTDSYIMDTVSKGMDQIDYMSKTIDDFRDFFKPCNKQITFDVKENISQVLSIFLPLIKNDKIDLFVSCGCEDGSKTYKNTDVLDFCPQHDVLIKGYPNQFKQVLLNLLSNSRYAILKTGEKNINIKFQTCDEKVRVIVEDQGGGISEEDLAHVFEPYFTTKANDGGTGIGLYMSKAIVEDNLGGSLIVENIDGGCRFIIEVDRVKGED